MKNNNNNSNNFDIEKANRVINYKSKHWMRQISFNDFCPGVKYEKKIYIWERKERFHVKFKKTIFISHKMLWM
jgi:hypothetical protein